MNLISVVVEEKPDQLQTLFKKQIESFLNEGVEIIEKSTWNSPFHVLEYSVKIESIKNYPVSDFINIFIYCAANALYEYIKLYKESQILNKLIEYDYYYFNIKEKISIQDNIKHLLQKEKEKAANKNNEAYEKKFKMIQKIVDYLKNDSKINLKGFITFRLKDYVTDLQEFVDRGVEEYLMDKEYNEFIKLLRYFVDIQEAKVDILHILFEDNNKYKLFDQYGKLVDNDYLKMIAAEVVEKDINFEDLLISSLITIAPNKVFIHCVSKLNNSEVIKTITRIFVDKVKICDNCDLCSIKVNAKKE